VPLPALVFPGPHTLASAHLVPAYPDLRGASEGHPRLWLLLHQKAATDFPAGFLDASRLVEQRQFGGAPTMELTVDCINPKTSGRWRDDAGRAAMGGHWAPARGRVK
jgi:hypothetical protein